MNNFPVGTTDRLIHQIQFFKFYPGNGAFLEITILQEVQTNNKFDSYEFSVEIAQNYSQVVPPTHPEHESS